MSAHTRETQKPGERLAQIQARVDGAIEREVYPWYVCDLGEKCSAPEIVACQPRRREDREARKWPPSQELTPAEPVRDGEGNWSCPKDTDGYVQLQTRDGTDMSVIRHVRIDEHPDVMRFLGRAMEDVEWLLRRVRTLEKELEKAQSQPSGDCEGTGHTAGSAG